MLTFVDINFPKDTDAGGGSTRKDVQGLPSNSVSQNIPYYAKHTVRGNSFFTRFGPTFWFGTSHKIRLHRAREMCLGAMLGTALRCVTCSYCKRNSPESYRYGLLLAAKTLSSLSSPDVKSSRASYGDVKNDSCQVGDRTNETKVCTCVSLNSQIGNQYSEQISNNSNVSSTTERASQPLRLESAVEVAEVVARELHAFVRRLYSPSRTLGGSTSTTTPVDVDSTELAVWWTAAASGARCLIEILMKHKQSKDRGR
jgi:hypothetical protein